MIQSAIILFCDFRDKLYLFMSVQNLNYVRDAMQRKAPSICSLNMRRAMTLTTLHIHAVKSGPLLSSLQVTGWRRFELQLQQMYRRTSAPSHDSDYLAHLHSLIRIFTVSLRICAVRSESSLGAFWIAKDAKFLPVDKEESVQTARDAQADLSLRWEHL